MDDDSTTPSVVLQTRVAPNKPPIGNTQFLLGLRNVNMRALMLNDAPEVCIVHASTRSLHCRQVSYDFIFAGWCV